MQLLRPSETTVKGIIKNMVIESDIFLWILSSMNYTVNVIFSPI